MAQLPGSKSAKRIGLLGGSFNPAHRGHLQISQKALERLRLDEVWWLVSPQNPLKAASGMAALKSRVAAAKEIATGAGGDPRIVVTDIERDLGTTYTVDTIKALKARFPAVRFVWLMGADNLIQFPRWRHWRTLFRLVPIAVFPRPTYSRRALSGKAARRFERYRLRGSRAPDLANISPPAWIIVRARPDSISATSLRQEEGR